MSTIDESRCGRCQRPFPGWESTEAIKWEQLDDALVCPDCLTHEEGAEIVHDYMQDLPSRVLSRDEALLILNDHCGEQVEVSVKVEKGDWSAWVAHEVGVLRHWRDDSAAAASAHSRDDITGLYNVGTDAGFDITELHEGSLLRVAGDEAPPFGIAFSLAESVWLEVVWGRR